MACALCGAPVVAGPHETPDGSHHPRSSWDDWHLETCQVIPDCSDPDGLTSLGPGLDSGYWWDRDGISYMCNGLDFVQYLPDSHGPYTVGVGVHATCAVILAHAMWNHGSLRWSEVARWIAERAASCGTINGVSYGANLGDEEQVMCVGWGDGWMLRNPIVLPPLETFEGSDDAAADAPTSRVSRVYGKLYDDFVSATSNVLGSLWNVVQRHYVAMGVPDSSTFNVITTTTANQSTTCTQELFPIATELTLAILLRLPRCSLALLERTSRSTRSLLASRDISLLWLHHCASMGWALRGPDGLWRTPHSGAASVDAGSINWRAYYDACSRSSNAWNCTRVGRIVEEIICGVHGKEVEGRLEAIEEVERWAQRALEATAAEAEMKPMNAVVGPTAEEMSFFADAALDPEVLDVELKVAASRSHAQFEPPLAGDLDYAIPLFDAALDADLPLLDYAARSGWNFNIMNSSGDTVVHLAARSGQYGALHRLYVLGADMHVRNGHGWDVWTTLAHHGRLRTLRSLVALLRPPWSTFTTSRVHCGQTNVGASAAGITPLGAAVVEGHLGVVTWLLSCRPATAALPLANVLTKETLLMAALATADLEMAKAIHALGASDLSARLGPLAKHSPGGTALHVATAAADRAAVAWLVPLLPTGIIDARDDAGDTALHLSAGLPLLFDGDGARGMARHYRERSRGRSGFPDLADRVIIFSDDVAEELGVATVPVSGLGKLLQGFFVDRGVEIPDDEDYPLVELAREISEKLAMAFGEDATLEAAWDGEYGVMFTYEGASLEEDARQSDLMRVLMDVGGADVNSVNKVGLTPWDVAAAIDAGGRGNEELFLEQERRLKVLQRRGGKPAKK
ncbi:hypothetical protein HK101_001024 [Irineochytrium annulatum]|nr:hypothetical protein HK101_001024 [Irineochytrium annulatum]